MTTHKNIPFSEYHSFFLVGIKGVAMTSIAQILSDLGKKIQGSDVSEQFVTQRILDELNIDITTGFDSPLPTSVDCVIYTAAHKGVNNPQVQAAIANNIPTFSQAEAISLLFNEKKGIAVCGVGGKSTVSAMITWILHTLKLEPSYSVGVGSILGMPRTGAWNENSEYFVIEADEYVINPGCVERDEAPVPRFSFLKPYCTVCTNLSYDHPDVYPSFAEIQKAYSNFFSNIKPGGSLIINHKDRSLVQQHTSAQLITFGSDQESDYRYTYNQEASKSGSTTATVTAHQKNYTVTLKVPGKYNIENAVTALAVCDTLEIPLAEAIQALSSFSSTQRRFEYKGKKNGSDYYDDYAHHPSELTAVIQAAKEWYPDRSLYIAFQPHTYSRTKSLLSEFAATLSESPKLILLDIFASAREVPDTNISSKILKEEILALSPEKEIPVLPDYQSLAQYLSESIPANSVILTVGAGDIYKVHELL